MAYNSTHSSPKAGSSVTVLAQCISGLQDVVAEQLGLSALRNFRLLHVEDGAVLYQASADLAALSRITFVNNQFLVLAEASPKAKTLPGFLVELVRKTAWQDDFSRLTSLEKPRHFRLVISDENHLVPVDRNVTAPLIDRLSQLTGLDFSPRGADMEFWAIRRRSGAMLFCEKLPSARLTERDLQKGELRPELAELLCRIAEPEPDDIVLDPFAGSGAIGFARARFPYNMMFLSDIDPANAQRIKSAVKSGRIREKKSAPVIIRTGDARSLDRIQDGFIDTIITDPPWGLYDDAIEDLQGFYHAVLTEFCRVLKPGGRLVMLLGRRDMIDDLRNAFADKLAQAGRFDILVSGKKAVIMKWRKRQGENDSQS